MEWTSIRCAVQHLIDTAPNVEAIALLVCDQPFVDSHTIEQLVGLREKTKKAIVSSSYAGTLGVPALFHRSCADELLHLDEESGGKAVISSNHDRVTEFTFPEGKIDIDTAADYARLHVSED
jgi:molybdenum cofactor cytidylyltransferase